MLPQAIFTAEPCELAERWRIAPALATKLRRAADRVSRAGLGELFIISGYRTCEQQAELEAAGRPTAPCDRSTHTSCPATGADVWCAAAQPTEIPGTRIDVSRGARFTVVSICESVGLRVGGGGPVDSGGLPIDWNHVDLGPRPVSH